MRSTLGIARAVTVATLAVTAATLAAATLAAATLAGCDPPVDVTGRLLEAAPAESEIVLALDPARVTGTWADQALTALADGAVPACVVDAARSSAAVVVAWAPGTGVLLVIAGPRARGRGAGDCPELLPRRGDRVWSAGLEPASDLATGPSTGGDRFFAARERRRRWASLPDAPLQGVADVEVAAGVAVHASGTIDPRDGLVARVIVRADDRATLLSLRDRYLRWRSGLDRERLGAAWPAIAAMTTAEDRSDRARTTDVLEVELRGAAGGEAAAMALLALMSGLGGAAPALPCPDSLGDYVGRAACSEGEVTLTDELWDELADDPSALTDGVRVVPWWRQGSFAGFRVEALAATDALTWLGFENGDVIDAIDDSPLTTTDQVLAAMVHARATREITVGIQRAGRHGTLRFRAR
jgi:hypothetical protein